MNTRVVHEQVTRLVHVCNVAVAWSETAPRSAASSARFDHEIVEADSARCSERD